MADENTALAVAMPDADGEAHAAWTAVQWRDHEAALRAAAADADCSSEMLAGLVHEVTRSLFAGAPPDDDGACEAAVECVNAVIDALHARVPCDTSLRFAVNIALHLVTDVGLHTNTVPAFSQAVAGALISMLNQFSLDDEPEHALCACSTLATHIRARIGLSSGDVTGELATAAAVALARTCVRYASVPQVSHSSLDLLGFLVRGGRDDLASTRRAVLDAAPLLPRVLLSALTSYGEAHSDDDALHAFLICALLERLAADAEVAALLRAEPGAANGEATSLRAAVRALRAFSITSPGLAPGALSTAEVLVATFAGIAEVLQVTPTQMFRVGVRSGLVEFQIELLISQGCEVAGVFTHALAVLQALVQDDSDIIARKAATQPAVNAVFAALRAHAATLDVTAAQHLSKYFLNAAHRFGRRPNGADEIPAALALAFVPLLRAHLDDTVTCVAVINATLAVSNFGDTPCGSMMNLRRCVPVLLEAMRRHAAAPHVAAHVAVLLSRVVENSFDFHSALLPPEVGDLQAVVASLVKAMRAAVECAASRPTDDGAGILMGEQIVHLTRPVRALADAFVPFEDEVARDPAMLAVLVDMLRLRPNKRVLVENVGASLRSVLHIDEDGSRAQKRAVVALLRSKRLGAAYCTAAEASGQTKPHCKLVMMLVAYFTRHGLHVDSSRSATQRATRTCDACGAVETQMTAAGSAKHKMCGRCLKVSYCSIACQHAAWPAHKVTCRAAEQS